MTLRLQMALDLVYLLIIFAVPVGGALVFLGARDSDGREFADGSVTVLLAFLVFAAVSIA